MYQVHYEEDTCHPAFRGILQPSPDLVEVISIFTLSELSFNVISFGCFFPGFSSLIVGLFGFCPLASQWWCRYPDAPSFQPPPVFLSSINLINLFREKNCSLRSQTPFLMRWRRRCTSTCWLCSPRYVMSTSPIVRVLRARSMTARTSRFS